MHDIQITKEQSWTAKLEKLIQSSYKNHQVPYITTTFVAMATIKFNTSLLT